jgi:hypothetical protein
VYHKLAIVTVIKAGRFSWLDTSKACRKKTLAGRYSGRSMKVTGF